jgi:hypothetical protein
VGAYRRRLGARHGDALHHGLSRSDQQLPQTVILTGFDLDEGAKLFGSCVVAAKNTNPFGVENEESRDHPDILLCTDLRMLWPDFWKNFRRFG